MNARVRIIIISVIFSLIQSKMAASESFLQIGNKHLKISRTLVNLQDPTELRIEADAKTYSIQFGIANAGYKKWLKKKRYEDNDHNLIQYRLKIREGIAQLISNNMNYYNNNGMSCNIYILVENDTNKSADISEVIYTNFKQWAIYSSYGKLLKPGPVMKKLAQRIEHPLVAVQQDFRSVSFTVHTLEETTKYEGDEDKSRSDS